MEEHLYGDSVKHCESLRSVWLWQEVEVNERNLEEARRDTTVEQMRMKRSSNRLSCYTSQAINLRRSNPRRRSDTLRSN